MDSTEMMASEPLRPDAALPLPRDYCRNCNAHTTGHFCSNCGQETNIALPTFRAFMREAAGRYVALDGRLWRTLFALVTRPGFLTLEYFAGRRRRYVRPARLFLVLWLLLFAVIGVVQSPADVAQEMVFVSEDEAGKGQPPDAVNNAGNEARRAAAGKLKQGVTESEPATLLGFDDNRNLNLRVRGRDLHLPAELQRRYDHFKKLPHDQQAERVYGGMLRYGTYAIVALLPAFALLLQLAYLGRAGRYPGRPRRYAEHLVYSAHLHAFAALVVMLMLVVNYPPFHAALALWIVFYVLRARQIVYRGRWWAGTLRTATIAMIYVVLVALAMFALLVISVMIR